MTQYIEFQTADGGTILVEVEINDEKIGGLVNAGMADKFHENIVNVRQAFEASMMGAVRRNADAFANTMRTLSNPPNEAQISFGVNATAEGGYAAIAKVSGESNYMVTLTWRKEDAGNENEGELRDR